MYPDRKLFWIFVSTVTLFVMGGVALGTTLYVQVEEVQNLSEDSDCRAIARADYDSIRDQRNTLISEGLVALGLNDEQTFQETAHRLSEVLRTIREQGTLADLFRRRCP